MFIIVNVLLFKLIQMKHISRLHVYYMYNLKKNYYHNNIESDFRDFYVTNIKMMIDICI